MVDSRIKTYISADSPRPGGGSLTNNRLIDPIFTIFSNWSLLRTMIIRDLSGRYRGSVVGLAWLVLLPFIMMIVYAGVFAGVLGVRFPGVEGATGAGLSIWIGIVLWQAFSETVIRATSSMHDNAPFVRRIPFPLAILPLVPLGTALIGVCVSFILFSVVFIIARGIPSLSWIQLPVLLVPFIFAAIGLSWLVASIGAFIRDLRQLMPVGMTLMMFATPIIWPVSAAPGLLQKIIFINPFAWFFEALRGILFNGQFVDFIPMVVAIVVTYAFSVITYSLFTNVQKVVADVV